MTGVQIMQAIIEILVGGISGVATGIGQGLSTLAQSVFLQTTGEGAGAGDDRALRLRHRRFHDAFASRYDEEVDLRMLEDHVRRLERRGRNNRHQVVDSVFGVNSLIETTNAFSRDFRRVRMRVENDGVSSRDHIDRVVGDRRQRVGARRNRADNAKGRVLYYRKTVVAAKNLRAQRFDALRVVTNVQKLVNLVL